MCDSTLFLRLHAKYVRTCKAICFSVWFLVCRQRCALTKAIASSSHMMAHDAGNFAPTRVYGEENPESDNTHHQIPTVEGDPIPVNGEGNPEADNTRHPVPTVEGDPIPVYGEGNPEADHINAPAPAAPPAPEAPATPPAFVPDTVYTTFSKDWFRVVRTFRRNGLAYFKMDGGVKHGYTIDGYGAVSYWHRDSEGHLTLTPVEGKLIHKLNGPEKRGPGGYRIRRRVAYRLLVCIQGEAA